MDQTSPAVAAEPIKPEPILDFVRRKLEEQRGTWVTIANDSGVPYHTLTKIAQGQVENPRIQTVQRLVDFFQSQVRAAA